MTVEALKRVLSGSGSHEIVWTTRDAEETASLRREDPPDLLLLDVALPGGGGVETTRRVMEEAPCAILVVAPDRSTHVNQVFEALGLGALDVVQAPAFDAEGEVTGATAFLARVATAEKLIGKRPPVSGGMKPPPAPETGDAAQTLVALGASTGGPQALAAVLSKLPRDLSAAVVIVQHIDDGFAPGLASWLTDRTGFPVVLARHGDVPRAGLAYLAGTEEHLVLGPDRTLAYTPHPADSIHRPSIDVLFASLAQHAPVGIAALLTGMGKDGAEGLLKLRRRGWSTLAQDARTSVVHGMPKAAADLGAADQVLPLEALGPSIAGFLSRAARRG
jgi:two-component system response regulator WspF